MSDRERNVAFRSTNRLVKYYSVQKEGNVSSKLEKRSGEGEEEEEIGSQSWGVKLGNHTRVEREKLQVGPFGI